MTSLSSTAGVKLARCLAKVPATTWEKVNFQLMSKCPELGAGPLNLNNRNQEAILALGVYFLESGFNHKDKILPYLLDTVKSMGTANFPDELPLDRSSKLPPAENFTFSLITLLNDVASHNPDPGTITTRIMDVQVELLTNILTRLEELRRQDKPASFNTRKMVCKSSVPVLLGLCRAMSRFSLSSEEFLFTRIYPNNKRKQSISSLGTGASDTDTETKIKGYSNYSKIRLPIFWLNKFPQLVREAPPIVFSGLKSFPKHSRRLEVPVLRVRSRLNRSISQVSSISRPIRPHLRRSLSIVSSHSSILCSRNSNHSSRSQTPGNTLVPFRQSKRLDV